MVEGWKLVERKWESKKQLSNLDPFHPFLSHIEQRPNKEFLRFAYVLVDGIVAIEVQLMFQMGYSL